MSSISATRRVASFRMWPINRGISSGFTIPVSIRSALPIIPWSGVFNSWETFAVNSLRFLSAYSCSVISNASITAPSPFPADSIRLISSWYSLPIRSIRISLCPSSKVFSIAALNVLLRSSLRKSCPTAPCVSLPKIVLAAGLMLNTIPLLSNNTSPSFMLSVIWLNSSVFSSSLRSCFEISLLCRLIRLSKGEISS